MFSRCSHEDERLRSWRGKCAGAFSSLLACDESKAIICTPVGGGSVAVAWAHAGGVLSGWEGEGACR